MTDFKRIRLADSHSRSITTATVPALPDEVMFEIFKFSSLVDMLHFERSCKRFRQVVDTNLPKLKKRLQFEIKYEDYYFDECGVVDEEPFYNDTTESLWISFNGHNTPGLHSFGIYHYGSPQRANDHEDLLHTLEEIETGSAIVWTTKPKETILSAVYKKLSRYCEITAIEVHHEFLTGVKVEQTSYCGPLSLFEDVQQVDVMAVPHPRLLEEDLQHMSELKILRICASKPDEEDIDFGAHPYLAFENMPVGIWNFDLRRFPTLQELKIISRYHTNSSLLNDDVLLESRDVAILVLANMDTQLTIRGIGAVLDEWVEGRRVTDTFYLRVRDGERFTQENNRYLRHRRRTSDGAELRVSVLDYHVLVRNRDSKEQEFTPFDYNEVPFIPYDEYPGYNYADDGGGYEWGDFTWG